MQLGIPVRTMQNSSHQLIINLENELRKLDGTEVPEPMLKSSPLFTNINEIYHDASSTLSVIPSRPWNNTNVSRDIINEVPEEDDEHTTEARNIANLIYSRSYREVDVSKYTSVLGGSGKLSKLICNEFMDLLQPWPLSLVTSLRKLSSKLYLIGESTQIDQILEIFSMKWVHSHFENQLGDYKSVHVICFALLILNSDLHNSYKNDSTADRFTKEEFVLNVWDALDEDSSIKHGSKEIVEPLLRSYYDSIFSEPLELLRISDLHHPHAKKKSLRAISSSSNLSTRSKSSVSSNLNTLSNISLQSRKHSKRLSSIGSTMSLSRELTNATELSDVIYDVDYQKDKYDEKLENLGPPWFIEGILKTEVDQKQSLNTLTRSRTSFRLSLFARLTNTSVISPELDIYNTKGWMQSITTIQRGLLKQYSFGSTSDRKNFMKTGSTKFVNTIITYNLYSAIATLVDDTNEIISNSTNKTDGHAWVLTIPNLLSNDYNDEKKIVYYAPSLQIANNFIETCNFWAARITSIPSTGDKFITNAEYGWSDEILTMNEGFENVKLNKWECLLSIESSFITSSFTIDEQFSRLKVYVEYLRAEIIKHNELRPVLERVWGKDESLKEKHQLAMNNWGEKYAHIYKQHEKFKTYLDSLAFAIAFKSSKI